MSAAKTHRKDKDSAPLTFSLLIVTTKDSSLLKPKMLLIKGRSQRKCGKAASDSWSFKPS